MEGVPKIVVVEMTENLVKDKCLDEFVPMDSKGRFQTGLKFVSTFGSNEGTRISVLILN